MILFVVWSVSACVKHRSVSSAYHRVHQSALRKHKHTHKVLRHTTVCECAHAVRVGTISDRLNKSFSLPNNCVSIWGKSTETWVGLCTGSFNLTQCAGFSMLLHYLNRRGKAVWKLINYTKCINLCSLCFSPGLQSASHTVSGRGSCPHTWTWVTDCLFLTGTHWWTTGVPVWQVSLDAWQRLL